MQFFLNGNFSIKNSGIEHAQLKRASLFEKYNIDYKLVFKDWNPLLHYYLHEYNIKDKYILNMFDYLQDTEQIKSTKVGYKDIDFGLDNVTYSKESEDKYYAYQDNIFLGRINLFKIDDAPGLLKEQRVKSVELFDGFGNLYRVDSYDYRGFKSLSQWYTPDNQIGTEVWYSSDGKPKVEDYYRMDGSQKMVKSGWKIIESNGNVKLLPTMTDIIIEFFNHINFDYFSKEQANTFIMDRSDLYEEALKNLELPSMKVLHLHNCHAGNAQRPDTSMMNNNYEYVLTNLNDYDAVISATHKQTKAVNRRFKPSIPLFTVPVGIIPNNHFDSKRIPMKERKQHSIVVTARIAPEKQIHKIIQAMGIAKKEITDINMSVYGYIDHSNDDYAINNINKMIDKYDLKDAVDIHEFTQDVASVQKNGQIYALASTMEGFNLSMMEAQSQGDVGVTHDVNYGPNELVINNDNGYVVDYDDVESMAKRFVELFSNERLLQQMSDRAYELSKRYSETEVYKSWKKFMDAMDKTWKSKIKYTHPKIKDGLDNMEENING